MLYFYTEIGFDQVFLYIQLVEVEFHSILHFKINLDFYLHRNSHSSLDLKGRIYIFLLLFRHALVVYFSYNFPCWNYLLVTFCWKFAFFFLNLFIPNFYYIEFIRFSNQTVTFILVNFNLLIFSDAGCALYLIFAISFFSQTILAILLLFIIPPVTIIQLQFFFHSRSQNFYVSVHFKFVPPKAFSFSTNLTFSSLCSLKSQDHEFYYYIVQFCSSNHLSGLYKLFNLKLITYFFI